MIKAYDNAERNYEGIIILSIQVAPIVQYTTCHVLDLDLSDNLLLGHPWLHAMQAIPSTYHQCLKFLVIGQEITIYTD